MPPTTEAARRLFVALDPPPNVRNVLAALRTDLTGARWTPAAKMHLTLRFLGDTPPERVAFVTDALAACRAPALDLRLDGLTTFPSARRPRVLVARIAPDDALVDLQAQIEETVQTLGYAPERRPFRPHVTLARLRNPDPRQVRRFVRAHEALDLTFSATQFHLYASTLHPEGAVYERLAGFGLTPTL